MPVVVIKEIGMRPGMSVDHAFDWREETFRFMERGTFYATGTKVRPHVANGFEYEALEDGQTTEEDDPELPITLDDVVTDGSQRWKCVAISTDGLLRSIQNSSFASEDAAVTVEDHSSEASAGTQRTTVIVSAAADADGVTYDVVNQVDLGNDVVLHAILRVTVEDEAD
jgi:hypothetical protein